MKPANTAPRNLADADERETIERSPKLRSSKSRGTLDCCVNFNAGLL